MLDNSNWISIENPICFLDSEKYWIIFKIFKYCKMCVGLIYNSFFGFFKEPSRSFSFICNSSLNIKYVAYIFNMNRQRRSLV
jgi:hypothetical protein